MEVFKLISNLLNSNTFILEKDNNVIIIDCGCEVDVVKKYVKGKNVKGVLLTHGHFDHSAHCNEYAKEFHCKIYANENIKKTLTDKVAIYSEDYSIINDLSCFEFVGDNCEINLGEFNVKCFHFPGHSHCSEGYVIEGCLFAGDFLFKKSFGRVDLKNGNKDDMLLSFDKIKDIDFSIIFSGHGEESTKEEQIRHLHLYKKFLTR